MDHWSYNNFKEAIVGILEAISAYIDFRGVRTGIVRAISASWELIHILEEFVITIQGE
jgi:hypothetical protein